MDFIRDDLTDLRHVSGTFDLLLDYGALNDLGQEDRDRYVQNVLPLTHHGSRYLLMCFDKKLGRGEMERRFGADFHIEVPDTKLEGSIPAGISLFVMTRTSSSLGD